MSQDNKPQGPFPIKHLVWRLLYTMYVSSSRLNLYLQMQLENIAKAQAISENTLWKLSLTYAQLPKK